jgi:ribosomal protein L13
MKYTIDATGKSLGRLASEVAALLNGKSSVSFVKNKVLDVHK